MCVAKAVSEVGKSVKKLFTPPVPDAVATPPAPVAEAPTMPAVETPPVAAVAPTTTGETPGERPSGSVDKKRRALATGRKGAGGTILTGSRGVSQAGTTATKTLLGE